MGCDCGCSNGARKIPRDEFEGVVRLSSRLIVPRGRTVDELERTWDARSRLVIEHAMRAVPVTAASHVAPLVQRSQYHPFLLPPPINLGGGIVAYGHRIVPVQPLPPYPGGPIGSGKGPGPSYGDCPTPCSSGQSCVDGQCVSDPAPSCDPPCVGGQSCIGGQCVSPPSPSCDPPCAVGQTCENGQCVSPQPPPPTPPPPTPPQSVCIPGCGSGFVCVGGSCVSGPRNNPTPTVGSGGGGGNGGSTRNSNDASPTVANDFDDSRATCMQRANDWERTASETDNLVLKGCTDDADYAAAAYCAQSVDLNLVKLTDEEILEAAALCTPFLVKGHGIYLTCVQQEIANALFEKRQRALYDCEGELRATYYKPCYRNRDADRAKTAAEYAARVAKCSRLR
jgi:hypothetical protein